MSSETDDSNITENNDQNDSVNDQDDSPSYRKIIEMLQDATKGFNINILEKYNEVVTDAIRNSGIEDAEEKAELFSKNFTKETQQLEEKHSGIMIRGFKKSMSSSIGIAGLSTTNIDISAQNLLKLTRFVNSISKEFVEKVLALVPNYYADQLLDFDDIEVTMPDIASELIEELANCPKSLPGWRAYEDVCWKILSYCFTPPLPEPQFQSSNEEGDHRRDIILDIPMEAEKFWGYIRDKYGIAVIVDAKNYEDLLPQNDFVIMSKYFSGTPRLAHLGMIFTRKGLSDHAKEQQKKDWQDSKHIICLNDEDLIKMIKLKVANKEPSFVIDKKIRDYLYSL